MDEVKIVIFGLGRYYENRKDNLEQHTIVAYIDNDPDKQKGKEGKVFFPKHIQKLEYDYIVIMSKAFEEMRNELLSFNVESSKIVSYDAYIKDIRRVLVRPDISIILPVYNSQKYILETIDVILNQTFTNFELIIIDDCPTDGTMDIVRSIKDNRIYTMHNKQNKGVSYTRNLGIKNARGEFIVFMDHDDTMPLNRLEKQYSFLKQHPDIGAVGGKTMYMDEKSRIKSTFNEVVYKNPKYIRVKLLETNVFINSAVMYRKSIIDRNNIYFWDDAYGLDDYIFLMEFSKYGLITGIDDVVHFYRAHDTSALRIILREQKKERMDKRNEVYHFAYSKEGFDLTEEQYLTILYAFEEEKKEPISFKLFGELMILFEEILKQAKAMKLDYIEELQQWMNEVRCTIK